MYESRVMGVANRDEAAIEQLGIMMAGVNP